MRDRIAGQSLIAGSTGNSKLSFVLEGPSIIYNKGISDNEKVKLFGALIISYAFVGSYIWSMQYLYRRVATVNLKPSTYYSIGIRIIFSVFVVLIFCYFFDKNSLISDGASSNNVVFFKDRMHFDRWPLTEVVPDFLSRAALEDSSITNNVVFSDRGALSDNNGSAWLVLIAFIAGMFPQRALQYLIDKVHYMRGNSRMKASSLPLEMIEGITMFERTRISEVGIDNVQNLAKSNFIEIIIRTPFSPREIIDWIGQARLFLFFKEDIQFLRNAGIRTIFNLKKLGADQETLQKIADLSEKIQLDKLQIVCLAIKDDPDINELERAFNVLVVGEQKEG